MYMEFCGVGQGNVNRAAVATILLEKAQTIEQKFPTNAVKLTLAQAIRSRLKATLFPNDPTWATFRYWNRDDVATGNFKKKSRIHDSQQW
jgi:hypothetical protein